MQKKIVLGSLLLCILGTCYSQDGNNVHKNYIEIGYSGGTNSIGAAVGVYGAAGFFFKSFGKASALDFRAKELYVSSPQREVGSITVTYRLFLKKGFFIGGGFAHNHETALSDYTNDIVGSTLGNSKKITHRTGLCLETGYSLKSLIKKGGFGIYPVFNLNVAYLVLDKEPNPYVILSAGFRFGFKRMFATETPVK
jgi:hypothetical protein